MRLTVQEGNRQYTPNRTTQENKNAKLTIQQGNRQHTPNKTAQENKDVKLAAQPGNRQHLSNVTLLKNLPASEASSFMRAKSYGENPQQNKTPASVPKIMSHPNNLKQKSRPGMPGELELLVQRDILSIFCMLFLMIHHSTCVQHRSSHLRIIAEGRIDETEL